MNAISKYRKSNLELFRIVCMLAIIAHHFVSHTGLVERPMLDNPTCSNSFFLALFGMWGKIGINCFLMITGYYMCTKAITIRKWLKLYFQILFYNLLITSSILYFYNVENGGGYFVLKCFIESLFPFTDISSHFVNSFLLFYPFIYFLNILINNMSEKEFRCLLLLLLSIYSVIGSIPFVVISFNYITWFSIVYLIAAYFRLFPNSDYLTHKRWGKFLFLSIGCSISSVAILQFFIGRAEWWFVADSNKILSLLVALSAFMWFKDLKISYNKVINDISATVFGVLLIHDNSEFSRELLWKKIINGDCLFLLPTSQLVIVSVLIVFAIFSVCSFVDRIRINMIEKPLFVYIDKKFWGI